MKGKIFTACLAAMLILGGVLGGLYHMENYDKIYYTKVDNTQASELAPGKDMEYAYRLDSYDEKGKKRTLKFETSKKLREDAYLMLEVKSMGVHKWEEVQFDDLPQAVQEELK
ncbi:MAG: YxeA family protein [Eubacterium sp.]|nr:YxeA family protein [Eubacterium sp.]